MAQTIRSARREGLYARSVNPQWVRLLELLEMNVQYAVCRGAELYTSDGRRILDFLSGYCVHNVGHNHPRIIAALKDELERNGPAMLQSHVSDLAGELAYRLCSLAGGRLSKAFFCSSGSEAVEAAIKFARVHTNRAGVLYAEGGFHGLTCGALSLMSNPFWREGFGPLLPGTEPVPFGDIRQLELKVSGKRFAAFIVEPVQGEGGVRLPPADYLRRAQELCHQHGTLLILDEVQTGMYRTGRFLASGHFGVDADMVVLAKALSGGLVPSGALLMSDGIYESVYRSLQRAIVHTSTYSENSLAMRAGLATLDVLEDEGLGDRAVALGEYLRSKLQSALASLDMVGEVRGMGLFCGVEFTAPKSMALRVLFETFRKVHPGLFGQALVSNLFRRFGMLTQICGNNFMVLKVAPPLVVSHDQIDLFVDGLRSAVEEFHSSKNFWSENLELARRAVLSKSETAKLRRRSVLIAKVAAIMLLGSLTLAPFLASENAGQTPEPSIDQGYRQMYNLDFPGAHATFRQFEQLHPDDPLGPTSDAAAYLFSEFDRLGILQTELFTDDERFKRAAKLTPDPAAKQSFDDALNHSDELSDRVLARQPGNSNALFAKVLDLGLRGDYMALIEKHELQSLGYMKRAGGLAETLLAADPSCYDAYLAGGVENYLLGITPAPVRLVLRLYGAQTNKADGIAKLRLTAEKGHYLLPYARLLLAVAALRDKDNEQAKELLQGLSREFPNNTLYSRELAKLH